MDMDQEHRQQALVWIGFWFGALGVYPLFCPWNTGAEKGCGIVLCALVTAILARLRLPRRRHRKPEKSEPRGRR
jgi:hypothetical protein